MVNKENWYAYAFRFSHFLFSRYFLLKRMKGCCKNIYGRSLAMFVEIATLNIMKVSKKSFLVSVYLL